MREGKIKKIIVTLLLGLLLCFVLIEVGLYSVGYLFKTSQEKLNKAPLGERDDLYKIVCFGDSTTAIGGKDSWPSQLEEVLNKHNLGTTFCVINEGVVLIDTSGIISALEKNLDEYDPDMIIIMAGLNDAKKELRKSIFIRIKKALHIFRLYRLAEQFWPNIFHANPIDYDNTEKAYSDPTTIKNFNRISNVLYEKSIKLIIMQYPLRTIEPLINVFHSKERMAFIDNKDLFKMALEKNSYEDLFVDRFAGDFGHCTKKGNRMIAENIAERIVRWN